MNSLDKKGYRLVLKHWIGNLGNHLVQLSGAINVAQHTQSRLFLPKHWLIKPRKFDFTRPANVNCDEVVESKFFFQPECFQFPVRYDTDRRELFQRFVYPLFARRSLIDWLRAGVASSRGEGVTPDTLVINMRSGRDIFRQHPPPQSDYMQPPISFYKRVIETHGYEDCLIVTEADRKNPCVAALQEWNQRIRLKTHRSVLDDARTILSATSLISCHSSFSWCLALMSNNLRTLHQPSTFQIKGVDAFDTYTYFFDKYIAPGEWRASNEQLACMISHSTADVRVVHEQRTVAADGVRPLSNFW